MVKNHVEEYATDMEKDLDVLDRVNKHAWSPDGVGMRAAKDSFATHAAQQ